MLKKLALTALVIGLVSFGYIASNQAANQKASEAAPIKVLLVTGDDVPGHKWKETTPLTREILESVGKFDVKVCEEIGILESPEALRKYDVLVFNFRNNDQNDISEKARQNLLDYVKSGKGLVPVHFNACAFRNWPEFRNLIGRIWVGGTSGHGPYGGFKAEVVNKEHPITKGVEAFEIADELYSKLIGEASINVLVQAYSDWSKKIEPLVWTLDYGKGRVFNTVLGHDVPARKNPNFGFLLNRGVEWAATGKVADVAK